MAPPVAAGLPGNRRDRRVRRVGVVLRGTARRVVADLPGHRRATGDLLGTARRGAVDLPGNGRDRPRPQPRP